MAGISHDPASGRWLLEMRSTSYAFGLADDGTALRHLHWGAMLPPAAVAALDADGGAQPWRRRIGVGRERPDEYVPWGARDTTSPH